jgi:hypothetical protein
MSDLATAGAVLLAGYILLMVGRAVAARIAGEHAELVLSPSLVSIYVPLPQRGAVGNEGNGVNTDNTATAGNTEIQPDTGSDMLSLSANGDTWPVLRMSAAERDELQKVRHESIALLQRCVTYYADGHLTDDGTIPRFDLLKMSSKSRGEIVSNLEYSGVVSVVKNSRTFVIPEISTCALLMASLVSNQRRVYPVGYAERKQELLDAAVNALPEVQR